jgi:hypothetical protein
MVEKKRVYRLKDKSFDVHEILAKGILANELDYERAMIADRQLRRMSKNDPAFRKTRTSLRSLIESYEEKHWKDEEKITKAQMRQSDWAERVAEKERLFLEKRKELIKTKLKNLNMTQQQLGELLGHASKSYMSELINGISPFSLRDMTIISLLFQINIARLVPVFLSAEDYPRIKEVIRHQNNPKLKAQEKLLLVA